MSITWEYLPGCPCQRCEQYRKDNGMTVHAFGATSWPDHWWDRQARTRSEGEVERRPYAEPEREVR
jgi:hypothetical protein